MSDAREAELCEIAEALSMSLARMLDVNKVMKMTAHVTTIDVPNGVMREANIALTRFNEYFEKARKSALAKIQTEPRQD